ncbi:MAG TPA: hypothetical protein VFG81_16500 [Anaerolineales bacterium]|nr:hypothetical protein [Anaerolineales bacterium]
MFRKKSGRLHFYLSQPGAMGAMKRDQHLFTGGEAQVVVGAVEHESDSFVGELAVTWIEPV